MPHPLPLKFVSSAKRHQDLPPSQAEVAMVGRSNVGKSSLINALANRKQLAHVSNTPGRTQLLNIFEQPNGPTVVDLPGYGYAKVPHDMHDSWQEMIEGYLLDREPLKLICILIDGEIGPTKLDIGMLAWARSYELPIQIVATKLDRVRGSKIGQRKADLAAGCDVAIDDVCWVSAEKGTGIDHLRTILHRVGPG
jgi:GTP-binding protein